MGTKIKLTHVKAHQDREGKELSWESYFNVKADELANAGRQKEAECIFTPNEPIRIKINNEYITARLT